MWKQLISICAAIFMTALSSYGAAPGTGVWSEAVNGVQGRLIISADEPVNGTRIVALYLELRNVSDIGNAIEIYFDPSHTFQCQLLDANDKPVATAGLPASIMVPHPFWLILPYDSSLRFRISVSGYGVPRNETALIPLECGDWVIKSGDVRDYELEVTFTVKPPKVDIDRRVWQGTLKLPRVKIP
jgi:hypothetical protein